MGTHNTDNIKPIGSLIAYDIALGLDEEDIAAHHGLSREEVQKISRGNLVKKKVREYAKEIEERLVQDTVDNPVRKFLHSKGLVACKRIVEELDNDVPEMGGSATTRLRAAELVLKYGGHAPQESGAAAGAVINITISQDKANMAERIAKEVIEHAPDYVDG